MTSALAGLKVVEWAEEVAGPYCGKLLADLGAEVVKVEPPSGDAARRLGPFPDDRPHPEQSALFAYLNTSKLGVTLNPAKSTGRAIFRQLLQAADVLIDGGRPGRLAEVGLSPPDLLAAQPGLVVVSVSPYGQTGPDSGLPGADLVTYQVSGFGYVTPGNVADPRQEPPLRPPGRQTEFIAGLTAAAATLHALLAREATGQGQHVNVSMQEAVASLAFMQVAGTAFLGKSFTRTTSAASGTAWINGLFRCSDGYVYAVMMEERQWRSWLDLLGNPPWADEPRFATGLSRNEHWTELLSLIEEWTATRPKAEVARLAQAHRVPVLPVNTVADVWASEQLAARGFFVDVERPGLGRLRMPAHPYQMSKTPWQVGPAPALGQHNEEILVDRLGYAPADLARLRGAEVI